MSPDTVSVMESLVCPGMSWRVAVVVNCNQDFTSKLCADIAFLICVLPSIEGLLISSSTNLVRAIRVLYVSEIFSLGKHLTLKYYKCMLNKKTDLYLYPELRSVIT